MKTMSFWNYFTAAVFTAVGLLLILLSQKFPVDFGSGDPGSGFWPIALGTIMIALSCLLVLQSLISPVVRSKMISLSNKPHLKVYSVMGLSVLFCILVYLIGFFAAVVIFIYTVMAVIGVSSRRERILTALAIAAALYLVFSVLLKTSLPVPVFLR